MRKRYRKAILLVELATFLGCSTILFDVTIYKHPFFLVILFFYLIGLLLGLSVSFLLLLITKTIFVSFLREKITYIIFLIILVFLGYWIGIFSEEFSWRVLNGTL